MSEPHIEHKRCLSVCKVYVFMLYWCEALGDVDRGLVVILEGPANNKGET